MDNEATLTGRERDTLLHAVGASKTTVGWRNRYLAASCDIAMCEALVSAGLFERGAAQGDCRFYRATAAGLRRASEIAGKPIDREELDLAQRRELALGEC